MIVRPSRVTGVSVHAANLLPASLRSVVLGELRFEHRDQLADLADFLLGHLELFRQRGDRALAVGELAACRREPGEELGAVGRLLRARFVGAFLRLGFLASLGFGFALGLLGLPLGFGLGPLCVVGERLVVGAMVVVGEMVVGVLCRVGLLRSDMLRWFGVALGFPAGGFVIELAL